jgi:hypothetical protein
MAIPRWGSTSKARGQPIRGEEMSQEKRVLRGGVFLRYRLALTRYSLLRRFFDES